MSKMSQLHAELSEQANELGFESYEEAIAKGYDVCYGEEGAYLYKPQPEDEQLKAHKAWLEERDEVLEELKQLHERLTVLGYDALAESVYKAINFIRGCHD